jgi:hypothetical protein
LGGECDKGKPMPEAVARANGKKSKVRAYVEHVFAQQKGPMDLVIRTIGLARATVKIGLANLTYNMKRAVWLSARTAAACSTQRNAVLAARINAARSARTSVRHRLTTFRRHRPTGNTVLGGVQLHGKVARRTDLVPIHQRFLSEAVNHNKDIMPTASWVRTLVYRGGAA